MANPDFDVNVLRSRLVTGGARPTLYQVQVLSPPGVTLPLSSTPFFIEATSLPESTVGVIGQKYMGREIRLAGDRKFGDWSVTVVNDEDFTLRNAFEAWSSNINTMHGNLRTENTRRVLEYKADAIVSQFAKTGELLRRYRINGIFPAAVGSIQLSWGAVDQIEKFAVTFAYDYWVLEQEGTSVNDGVLS